MKEEKSEKQFKAVETGGSKSVGKMVALKDFRQSRRGVVYVEVKKGDDCSNLDEAKKALLKQHGVI